MTQLEILNQTPNLIQTAKTRAQKCSHLADSLKKESVTKDSLPRFESFVNNCKIAVIEMRDQRIEITRKLTDITKMFTTPENEIVDRSNEIKDLVSKYNTELQKELHKAQSNQRAKEAYEFECTRVFKKYSDDFQKSIDEGIKTLKLSDLDARIETFKNLKFVYPRKTFESVVKPDGIEIDDEDLYKGFNHIFKTAMDKMRNDIIVNIPNIRAALIVGKEIVNSPAQLEVAKEIEKIESEMINKSLNADVIELSNKFTYELEVLNHDGIIDIFRFWITTSGKTIELAKLGTWSIDRMIKYAESEAKKGTLIESNNIKYTKKW